MRVAWNECEQNWWHQLDIFQSANERVLIKRGQSTAENGQLLRGNSIDYFFLCRTASRVLAALNGHGYPFYLSKCIENGHKTMFCKADAVWRIANMPYSLKAIFYEI